ncbi:hypothetical protein O2N63_10870 [Aliiroseovarius sp. KMU-50]|uniref:Cold shock domain-containing protein n=1 Tax=Aliiroseovarius salicola TaxID=3009082 RepID=A0ABT4W250_9RHOB|nr:hypothetical protein [Aliiroseovarius sp. KMU-50]MDA5094587.1 hypothetical protein [Aliiroseovarius sp. KMU-50]
MNGIVLWYKVDKKTGLVWCEDQGPLAFITSNTELEEKYENLEAGDQIVFKTHKAGEMREIRKVLSVRRGSGNLDVQALLAEEVERISSKGAEQTGASAQPGGHLRVVA